MILPLWRAAIPLATFAASGAVLDRVLCLDLGGGIGKWPRWTACGLVACFAAALHPIVLAALIALAAVGRLGRRHRVAATPPHVPIKGLSWLGLAAFILILVVVCRPATLVYWDSFVWLAKARIESEGWGALRAAALDRSADVVPSGYPMLWSLAASWLSMSGRTMDALAAGATVMTLLTLLLFLDAVTDAFFGGDRALDAMSARPRWALAALALLGVTPLVLVHLRSAYADLPVGLLAATCTLRLAREIEVRGESSVRDRAVAAIAAVALAGLKDEGAAHVAALMAAIVVLKLLTRERVPMGGAVVASLAAAVPFCGWRLMLRWHHVSDVDHQLGMPDLGAAGTIAHTVFVYLADTRSWGALWPIAIACAGLVAVRGRAFRAATRFAAFAFASEAFMVVAGALLFGPARVRVFAFEGTLVNRLLMQLVPPAGVMLVLALGDAAAAYKAVRSSVAQSVPAAAAPTPVTMMTRRPE